MHHARMARHPPARDRFRPHSSNKILAALPDGELEQLVPRLTVVPLVRQTVLAEPGDPVRSVYFPHNGVVSMVISMEDGMMAESATVGPEGMVGLSAVFGLGRTHTRNIVQVTGAASRIDAALLQQSMLPGSELHRVIRRYLDAFLTQILYTAACNSLHSVEERCARWLLMAHDRTGEDTFDLTQAFLAEMLGVRRASVNLVSSAFQRAGLISYGRGSVTIVDRSGLEDAACECYAAVRAVFAQTDNY